MDFTGRGYITEDDFMSALVIKRIPFTPDDVKEYFKQQNLFCSQANLKEQNKGKVEAPENSINFDKFKKTFFPHLYQVDEDNESEADKEAKKTQKQLKENKEKQPEVITNRLKKLEQILKDKFSNNWESVRKAFLDLDTDYDGYITVEDILRYFGQEKDFSYNDLKKLITDKDSRKIGKIGYTDFSKWVGNSIHMSEGFYFRHDSIKNPQYEKNLEKQEKRFTDAQKKQQQDCLINENLEKTVLDKMQFQWKTLRKAFMDLNAEKSGFIEPEELRFYLKHWGLNLTDEQFMHIFNKFDLDKDGKISYKDFQVTIGSEIHPAEGLYFRQDKPTMNKINCCKHEKCWQPTSGSAVFCTLHQKMHQDQCLIFFGRVHKKLGEKWKKMLNELRKNSSRDDQNQIFFEDFCKVLEKFNIKLKQKEKENLLDSFPGIDEGTKRRLNIARLYDQKYNEMLTKMYKQIDMHENDGSDDPVDISGYLGQFYREKKVLTPISEQEFISIINSNNKLAQIIRMIKEIDKSHNGYVTSTELDDIIKLNYKQELENRDLTQIIKKYSSIQNRILIDYKKFKDDIISQLKMINSNYTYIGSESPSPQKSPYNARNSILAQLHQRIVSGEKSPLKLQSNDAVISMNELFSNTNRKKYNTQGRVSQLNELNRTSEDTTIDDSKYKSIPKERKSTMNVRPDEDDLVNHNSLLQNIRIRKSTNNIQEIKDKIKGASINKSYDHGQLNKSVGQLNNRIDTNKINYNTRNAVQSSTQLNDYVSAGPIKHHSFNRAMNRTIQESSHKEILDVKFKDALKHKLGYEWKNIFRILNNGDKNQNGYVTKQEFEICTHQCGAILSREDMRKILELYGKGDKFINYYDISKDLGMATITMTNIKTPNSKLSDYQKLRALYSTSEHLTKFLAKQDLNPEQQMRRSFDKSQIKASTTYGGFHNSNGATVSGVSGNGIDAKDFLKFYI